LLLLGQTCMTQTTNLLEVSNETPGEIVDLQLEVDLLMQKMRRAQKMRPRVRLIDQKQPK